MRIFLRLVAGTVAAYLAVLGLWGNAATSWDIYTWGRGVNWQAWIGSPLFRAAIVVVGMTTIVAVLVGPQALRLWLSARVALGLTKESDRKFGEDCLEASAQISQFLIDQRRLDRERSTLRKERLLGLSPDERWRAEREIESASFSEVKAAYAARFDARIAYLYGELKQRSVLNPGDASGDHAFVSTGTNWLSMEEAARSLGAYGHRLIEQPN